MEQWAIVEMTSSDRKRKSLEACDSVCDKGKGVMEEPPDLGILHIQQRQSEGGLLIIEASTPILVENSDSKDEAGPSTCRDLFGCPVLLVIGGDGAAPESVSVSP